MIDLPRPLLGRLALTLLVVATGLTLVLTIGVRREDGGGQDVAATPRTTADTPQPEPHAKAPRAAVAAPVDRPNASDQAELEAWADEVAESTGVPARVLAAYGRAEMWLRGEQPGCRLSWGTLAGIGRVESRHGTIGGGEIKENGMPTSPIVGIPLDGSPGVKEIRDTDDGRLDADRTWDRAVGPMQFLPTTWERWGKRAVLDGGEPDPQNIDDAALAAARYLCWNGRDLSTPEGWWDAVLTYNVSVGYGRDVFAAAESYAEATA
ncbi:Membrane-bound lytic murein transglycosylase B [Prauserella marina]|uniref:Membrane-bound lytic murein transglycosylase B n=1 Tax=Prauserella marina TaxID=530584 RepID=A0A1G6WNG7_9PSEU|nr:murein transglycosylase [Prauserella marina]PWV73281.1 membrane-bound lytic murein transglycosylase B [Prauserella marina]SDD67408.1 Membrane-bound lytic murein transglycosylase B [Prauserella marina]